MDYTAHSDRELLAIFRSGDIQGFDALFNRYWKSLFSLAKKILDDEQLAEDVLQEAFVALYENAGENNIDHVRAYLYQTVKYQCFMHLRSGRISEKHLARLQMIRSSNNVQEHMDFVDLEALLMQQMETLPEKCREVFYLSRYELLSNKKIAEQLNISQKTVEHQITKALKTLRLSVDKMALVAFFTYFFKNF